MEIVLIILALYLFILGFVFLFTKILEVQKENYDEELEYQRLKIVVTKDNEHTPMIFESIYSALHGLHQKISFYDRFLGKSNEKVALEVAHVGGKIHFYISIQKHLQKFIEGQIYAQYPDVEIFEVHEDVFQSEIEISSSTAPAGSSLSPALHQRGNYKKVTLDSHAITADLELKGLSIFPMKMYSTFGDTFSKDYLDPLASITAPISELNNSEDKAFIQLVIEPLDDKWQNKYFTCLSIFEGRKFINFKFMQDWYADNLMSRNPINKVLIFPIYFVLFFFSLFSFKPVDVKDESEGKIDDDKKDPIKMAVAKGNKFLFDANIRICYIPFQKNKQLANLKLREVISSFKQFNLPHVNGFKVRNIEYGAKALKLIKDKALINPFILNTEELSTIYHLPNIHVKTPNIQWVTSRKLEPPGNLPLPNSNNKDLTLIGKTNFRGNHKLFGIKNSDRRRHMYILGKTGMGKSVLLENMIISDIQRGAGVAVVDPHGDLAEKILEFIPPNRTNDIIIFDPADRDNPVAFNMLDNIDPAYSQLVGSGLVGVFKKLYAHSWGPRLEHILRNTILTLLEYPNTTMLGITRLLQDKTFRRKVTKKLTDPILISFWENEFEKMQDRQKIEAISPILNKVGQFLSSPIVRNIVGQPKSAINIRKAMDEQKIIIVNLSKGKIGEDNSALLGSMFITKFQLDAMSRADIPEEERKDFYLYVDEFQNFATDSFATILSEARKYKLSLTVANQYIEQMSDEVKNAVFGNVGTILSFQVGYDDATYIEQQYREEVSSNDLVALSKYTVYSRLLIDGMPSKTFSAATLPPRPIEEDQGRKEKVIRSSRERYSKKRELVEDKIRRWHTVKEEKDDKKLKGTNKSFNKPYSKDHKENKDYKGKNDHKAHKENKDYKGKNDHKAYKENKDYKGKNDHKAYKENKDSKNHKDK